MSRRRGYTSIIGTPNFMAPEQVEDSTNLEYDNLLPEVDPCDNCGHVHFDGDWVVVEAGMCAPDDVAPTLRKIEVPVMKPRKARKARLDKEGIAQPLTQIRSVYGEGTQGPGLEEKYEIHDLDPNGKYPKVG